MLNDPVLCEETIEQIHQQRNAEWALQAQCDRLVKVFDEMDDPYLKTRKDDILHVVQRIQSCMQEDSDVEIPNDGGEDHLRGKIIIADDMTPADTLVMQHQKIAGFITEFGGPLSHTAILARSLGIPAIVGVHNAKQILQAHEVLVMDGIQGMVIAAPDNHTLKHFKTQQKDERHRLRLLADLKNKPCITQDGIRIHLHANIDRPEDVKTLRQYDHTGVGLYRTEMLFIEANEYPDEEQQFETYRKILRSLKGHPLTIRTLDMGADKEMGDAEQHGPLAHNPAMGLRAIRRCLKEPQVFKLQLKAILRAGAYGPACMMIPMITSMHELQQTLDLIEGCKLELRAAKHRFDPDLPIGAMIEVPAAALSALSFAERLDFLSIGTNDLIQYTLALDRVDDEVNYLYNPLHPAVLRLIDMTIKAGEVTGKPVSLCGEMASDPKYTRLLLGLGLKCFSVQTNALLEIKHIINNNRFDKICTRVQQLLTLPSTEAVEEALEKLNHDFA